MFMFFKIMLTEFIAEMGDKTQFMMIAMASRFKIRDIIIGSGIAILILNGLAALLGAVISKFVPIAVIRIIAALAFLYFAITSIGDDDEEEEAGSDDKKKIAPVWIVFGTFFLAELGDKTQLTAITFAANEGMKSALIVWLACSIGLFAADVIGMLMGYFLSNKMPTALINMVAFIIFAVFGIATLWEGVNMLLDAQFKCIVITASVSVLFAALCIFRFLKSRNKE